MIHQFLDNDLYKFTTMFAIAKKFPKAWVRYTFVNRGDHQFPEGFEQALRRIVDNMANLALTNKEEDFLRSRCDFFDPVFFDLLKGYRYNPDEVSISQEGGVLKLEVEGYWYRAVLWEVPLMAMISELYFEMTGQLAHDVVEKATYKAKELNALGVKFSDFGTRRRYSQEVHDKVLSVLLENDKGYLSGTSNVALALKYDIKPIGTHPHEWFMFHGAIQGYRHANAEALASWVDVYKGDLGIALTDTYTSNNFFENFTMKHAKLFDGLRWDSGDPISFTEKALACYRRYGIDSMTKTIVYSDSLDLDTVKRIHDFTQGKILDAYGIGTYFSNDVGVKPLNMVIKLTHAAKSKASAFFPVVKLSDVKGKNSGELEEIALCRRSLQLDI